MVDIGRWIYRSRRLAGLSQRQLETSSGVDQTIISKLENGRLRTLRLIRLAAIVGALAERDRERLGTTRDER